MLHLTLNNSKSDNLINYKIYDILSTKFHFSKVHKILGLLQISIDK